LTRASQAKRQGHVTPGIALTLLGILAALARLPLIRTDIDVSPDGCEYLGIARHLVSDGQWLSSLKWHFFTDGPVVHPALADRPPLYPLWAAGWMALSSDPEAQVWLARFGNLLLSAVLPALIYWALRGAVRPAAAALAAGIFLAYPAFLRYSAQPLTENLFLLLQFASLGMFLRARSPRLWVAAGFLAGLAHLTRPSGVLLLALYLVALLFGAGRVPEKRWSAVAGLLGGFLLPLLPYHVSVFAQTGSPFTSVLRYNYSIGHIDEGTLDGFDRLFPSPAAFLAAQPARVVRLIAAQWQTMGWALLRSLQFLLPLILFWRVGLGWERSVLLGLAALNFLFHAMSWTVWGAARYMLPSFLIGMALLLDAPLRWADAARPDCDGGAGAAREDGKRLSGVSAGLTARASSTGRLRLAWAAVTLTVGLTLVACLEQDVRLYRQKQEPYAGVELGWAYAAAAARLSRTDESAICAANQPWIVNLMARRPAVMAPRFRDVPQLRRYLSRYQPATLTLFLTERREADVRAATILVQDLWRQPLLRPELSDELTLETAQFRPGPRHRQALLMFRIHDRGAGGNGRPADAVRPSTPPAPVGPP
jgi:4-amino-4-deoxy-L-arabinose transferase-like glycosyltransferase